MGVAYVARRSTHRLVLWSASEDGASCQQRYSSVIRRRLMVASSMFTRRAGAGSAEARRAVEQTERGSRLRGPEQKL